MTGAWVRSLSEAARRTEDGFKVLDVFLESPKAANAQRLRAIHQELERLDIDAAFGAASSAFGPEREWVFSISRAFDGMLRHARDAAEEMLRLGVKSDRLMRDMGRASVDACAELAAALRDVESRPRRAGEAMLRAKKFLHRTAELARKAIANVLEHPNAVERLKTREIYRHFLEIADRGDAAAEGIGDMLVGLSS